MIFYWFSNSFGVSALQSQLWFIPSSVEFPFQFPFCSSQLPNFEFSFPRFPFPAWGQAGHQSKLGKADGAGPWRQHVLGQSTWVPVAAFLAARFGTESFKKKVLSFKGLATPGGSS